MIDKLFYLLKRRKRPKADFWTKASDCVFGSATTATLLDFQFWKPCSTGRLYGIQLRFKIRSALP